MRKPIAKDSPQVKFHIMKQYGAILRELGYSQQQLREMSCEQLRAALFYNRNTDNGERT